MHPAKIGKGAANAVCACQTGSCAHQAAQTSSAVEGPARGAFSGSSFAIAPASLLRLVLAAATACGAISCERMAQKQRIWGVLSEQPQLSGATAAIKWDIPRVGAVEPTHRR